MSVSIRYATIDDAMLIADISHQTFYETFASVNRKEDMEKFLNEQFTKGKLILEVGRLDNIFLLAYNAGEIAGYVKLRDTRIPGLQGNLNGMEIARIYAMASMIGKGVGSALMQASIDIAKEKAKNVIWLGVWEKNERAIEFYTRWGFQKFGETDFLLGDDIQKDWLMKKEI